MTKKRVIATLALLTAVITAFAAYSVRPSEPVLDGKRLSKWVAEYENGWPHPEYKGDKQMLVRAEEAVRKIGTNAIPWLLVELSAKEETSGDALPTNFTSGEAIKRRFLAVSAFCILGQSAAAATPKLVKLLDDKQTSYTAAIALGGIGVESIPILTQALANKRACARESAARVLGTFGAKAQSAVSSLTKCTQDSDSSVRSFATFALKQIARDAAPKVDAP